MPSHVDIPDLLDRPRQRIVLRQPLRTTTEAAWASLTGTEDWTQWLGARSVRWVTDAPHGVGSRRIVTMGPMEILEHFTVWEEGRRFAFRFVKSSMPVRAFAEDYVLEPTSTGCTLHWTIAVDALPGVQRGVLTGMRINGARTLPKLAALLAGRS
ncbi:MAG: SRPBCC family protein [Deltaproteobacteria bacterium]